MNVAAPSIDAQLLADVLSEIAETASETLELQDVFDRVATSVRRVIPFDNMGVVRLIDDARAVLHASTVPCQGPVCTEPIPLTSWSPRMRPRSGPNPRIEDALIEFDRSFFFDAKALEGGVRSAMWEPFRSTDTLRGGVWLAAYSPHAFTDEHQDVLRPIAALLGSAVEHWRLWDIERRRRDRLDRIEALLSTLAESLDVREVFQRLSDGMQQVLPHDLACLTELDMRARTIRVSAEARERAERLEATVETLARELESRGRGRIIGVSPSWKQSLLSVKRVTASETTVLITGESGTGKEVISSLIHQGSPRSGRPFGATNCAALPEQLLESELFGHEKGAFTGAIATKISRLEQAAGGTLFTDEIAEMSTLVQAKFLRVLEEREFQRVGGTRTLKTDVRVIAATNRDLAASIARQTFREDLYYRLNVFQIHIAPLRQRPEDILPLAETFLEELGRAMGRPAAGISRDGRDWLLAYRWPGNVRELRNAIERAILLCDGGLITRQHLPAGTTLDEADPLAEVGAHANGVAAPAAHGMNIDAME